MVLAGFAFTAIILPKANLVPALVAGFTLVLIITSPGIVNLPLLTSFVASSVRTSRQPAHCAFLKPVAVASASAMPLFGKALTLLAFMTFMAFMAVFFFITFGAAAFMAFMAAFFFITLGAAAAF